MRIEEVAAKQVVAQVLDGLDRLCVSVSIVKENCDQPSFEIYRRSVAEIVARAGDEMLEPIFRKFPDLRP